MSESVHISGNENHRKHRGIGLPMCVARFVLVGLVATGIHFVVALTALRLAALAAPLANAIGFAVALAASFVGHSAFTFKAPATVTSAARFTLVSLITVSASSGVVAWLSWATRWPGIDILAIGAIFAAGSNFAGHLLWSFRQSRA